MKTLIRDYRNRPGEHCGSASTTTRSGRTARWGIAACTWDHRTRRGIPHEPRSCV